MPGKTVQARANKINSDKAVAKLRERQAKAAQDALLQQNEAAPAATINAEPKPCKGRPGRKPGSTMEDYLIKGWHEQALPATTADSSVPLTRAKAAACKANTNTCTLQQTQQVPQKVLDALAQARSFTDALQMPQQQMPGVTALGSFGASVDVPAVNLAALYPLTQLRVDSAKLRRDNQECAKYHRLQDTLTKADDARADGFVAEHSKQTRRLQRLRPTGELKAVDPQVCQDDGDSLRTRSSSSLKRQPVKPASDDQAAAASVRPASNATRPASPDPSDPSPCRSTKETFRLPPIIRRDELKMGTKFAFGGFGEVWSATWRGRDVAVKRLKDAKLKCPEARRLMLEECARHHDLVHPCLLHAYGIVDDGDWLAIVTPLMAHGSVLQAYEMLAEDHIWDDELMVKILLQVAWALEWLHARGYVHMDLKSANILVDLTNPDEPVVMLADLGLTKYKRVDWFTSGIGSGTMEWMAPEHFGLLPDVQLSSKVDTWSYACTMWEMLHSCKYEPFRSPDDKVSTQQMRAGLHLQNGGRPAIPAAWRERCPKLVQLMEACWAWHPKDRPGFTAIAKEVEAILHSMQAVASD